MRELWQPALVALALGVMAPPLPAQQEVEESRWYWGGQAGVVLHQTIDASGTIRASTSVLDVGGHWLITRRRTGLYVAYDQLLFDAGTTSAFRNNFSTTGFTEVQFRRLQRIQGVLLAMPSQGAIQPLGGLGFAIQNITDAVVTAAPTSSTSAAFIDQTMPQVTAKAFMVVMGGFQWRMGRWAWFGQYQYMPAGEKFLLANAQHAFVGGLRFALSAAHEEIGTER